MSTLMIGTVKATGTKELVLGMFNSLEDYYDKALINESGTDNSYKIEFKFSSNIFSFFSYEYFEGYSEEFDCEIIVTMGCEEVGGEPMVLHYKSGEIIKGLLDYGIDVNDF